jgi:D-alanyl-D-alanine carboxypeptidase/D-alanyl-D-alanine-endopeptidase (penicillin-binding protein 4)
LTKGAAVVSDYAKKELRLKGIQIVEGSGISRENRLSALEMLTILKRFKPYRHLLNKKDQALYKTGSLQGVRTRAGYIERSDQELYYFVIFFNRAGADIEALMKCVMHALADRGSKL